MVHFKRRKHLVSLLFVLGSSRRKCVGMASADRKIKKMMIISDCSLYFTAAGPGKSLLYKTEPENDERKSTNIVH